MSASNAETGVSTGSRKAKDAMPPVGHKKTPSGSSSHGKSHKKCVIISDIVIDHNKQKTSDNTQPQRVNADGTFSPYHWPIGRSYWTLVGIEKNPGPSGSAWPCLNSRGYQVKQAKTKRIFRDGEHFCLRKAEHMLLRAGVPNQFRDVTADLVEWYLENGIDEVLDFLSPTRRTTVDYRPLPTIRNIRTIQVIPPSPPLVGVEPNPGPMVAQNRLMHALNGNAVLLEEAAVLTAEEAGVGIEAPSIFEIEQPLFSRASASTLYNAFREWILTNPAGRVIVAGSAAAGTTAVIGGIGVGAYELGQYLKGDPFFSPYKPPPAPLVGIEPNPGPLTRKQIEARRAKQRGMKKKPQQKRGNPSAPKGGTSLGSFNSGAAAANYTTNQKLGQRFSFGTARFKSMHGLRVTGAHRITPISSATTPFNWMFKAPGAPDALASFIAVCPNGNGGAGGSTPFAPTNSFMSRVSNAFGRFMFRKLCFRYYPTTSTNTGNTSFTLAYAADGVATLSTVANLTDVNLAMLQDSMSFTGFYGGCIEATSIGDFDEPLYTQYQGISPTDADLRQAIQGALLISYSSPINTGSILNGNLWVEYTCDFFDYGSWGSSGVSLAGPVVEHASSQSHVSLDEHKLADAPVRVQLEVDGCLSPMSLDFSPVARTKDDIILELRQRLAALTA